MSKIIENIKNLREISGVGFLDCKKALENNNNNIEQSIDYLRKKGLSKVSKKLSRKTNEGAVGVFVTSKKTLLIEVNSETDFAAKNEIFINFIEKIANYALTLSNEKNIDVKEFLNTKFDNKIILEYFTEIISRIGENIVLRRLNVLKQDINTKIFSYTHNSYKKNIGKICVALKAEIESENQEINELGKGLCMHIAAMKPLSLNINNLDKNIIEKEKEIQIESIKSSGKSNEIIDKILEGKMKKFFSEVTLLNQNYILETDKNIDTIIKEFNSTKGKFNIIDYSYYVLGS